MNGYPDDFLQEELCQGNNLRRSGRLKHQVLSLHLQLNSVSSQELHRQQISIAAITQVWVIIAVETRHSECFAVIPDVDG